MTLKEDLEEAVITSNIILFRWAEMKPGLLNTTEIRGMVIYNIKRALTKSMVWRDRKLFVISRILLFSIDPKYKYITNLWIQEQEPAVRSPRVELLSPVLNSLDYETLGKKAMARSPRGYNELAEVNFDRLINFKFVE